MCSNQEIEDYIIVSGNSKENVVDIVRENIKLQYVPIGGISISNTAVRTENVYAETKHTYNFAQAMIKYKGV